MQVRFGLAAKPRTAYTQGKHPLGDGSLNAGPWAITLAKGLGMLLDFALLNGLKERLFR